MDSAAQQPGQDLPPAADSGAQQIDGALPALREELTLHAGVPGRDGAPTWNLQDPVRHQFFHLDWSTFEILSRWQLGDCERVAAAVSAETPLEITPEDVLTTRRFVQENQLCQRHDAADTAWLAQKERGSRSSVSQWLLHHYLFFRLPLFRPDRWLAAHQHQVDVFYSAIFFKLTGLVLLFGLVEVYRQWEHFSATLVDTLSWQGLAGYGAALIFVKILHEFGHAFTARRKGCRVPTMGVAFLVMWPVAYTDVNEAWKLTRRQDRLAVGGAGIVTELVVASWATLAWTLLPDGILRGMAFMLATTTWISTLAINASPFMRFDGYFLLSDFLDFPNLHSRSFALARWDLRERLFDLGEAPPETLPETRQRTLIIFAWAVWIYRLALFLGIAALVYHTFFKALGLFLFGVEILWFVIRPFWVEIAEWRRRWENIRQRPRSRRTAIIALGFVVLGIVPWNWHVNSQGVLRAARHYPLYSPGPAQITHLPAPLGGPVEAGSPLVTLMPSDSEFHEQQTLQRLERLRWQVRVAGFDSNLRTRQLVAKEEMTMVESELAGLQRERALHDLRAPFAGVLLDVPPDLRAGEWVKRDERLGVLIDPGSWQIEAYLEESEIARIAVGDSARFFPETAGHGAFSAHILRIEQDATRQLQEPMLASAHGGQLLVREKQGRLLPERAIYRVTLQIDDADAATRLGLRSVRGKLVIYGTPRTLLGDFMRNALTVLIRESGW